MLIKIVFFEDLKMFGMVYPNDTAVSQNETFIYLSLFLMLMEATLFVKFLGDSPKIRVLDLLITGRELDYSISDIAGQAGIGRATFYRMIDELLKNKIIVPTRKFGNIQLYRLNLENEFVYGLVKLYDYVIHLASEKEVRRQKGRVVEALV